MAKKIYSMGLADRIMSEWWMRGAYEGGYGGEKVYIKESPRVQGVSPH